MTIIVRDYVDVTGHDFSGGSVSIQSNAFPSVQGQDVSWLGSVSAHPSDQSGYQQLYILRSTNDDRWFLKPAGTGTTAAEVSDPLTYLNQALGTAYKHMYWLGVNQGFNGRTTHVQDSKGSDAYYSLAVAALQQDYWALKAISDPQNIVAFHRDGNNDVVRFTGFSAGSSQTPNAGGGNVVGLVATGAGDAHVRAYQSKLNRTIALEADTPHYFACDHVFSSDTTATGIKKIIG